MAKKEKTIEELRNESETLWKKYWKIRNEIIKKEISQYDFEGKYVKIYGPIPGDSPTYMHVNANKITVKPFDNNKEKQILLQGHGFSYTFGSYTDSNYTHYSQWLDEYINLENFLCMENQRKNGKLVETDYGYNRYAIVEITKEEFETAFHEMINGMSNAFNNYEANEKPEIKFDNEK